MAQARQIDPIVRSGYNGTGGTLSKGTIVLWKTSGVADEIIASTAATDAYAGVCMNDIADGEYGDIQVGGVALVVAGVAGITKGSRAMWATGAYAVACTSGNAILGVAKSTATSGNYFECELCIGGPEMP